jgi:hypothetical protein
VADSTPTLAASSRNQSAATSYRSKGRSSVLHLATAAQRVSRQTQVTVGLSNFNSIHRLNHYSRHPQVTAGRPLQTNALAGDGQSLASHSPLARMNPTGSSGSGGSDMCRVSLKRKELVIGKPGCCAKHGHAFAARATVYRVRTPVRSERAVREFLWGNFPKRPGVKYLAGT